MQITSKPLPNTLYFQKAVPDITIQKTSETTSVLFQLYTDEINILTETYTYNSLGNINIRELYKICEKYLIEGEKYKEFECSLTEDTTEVFSFEVLKWL